MKDLGIIGASLALVAAIQGCGYSPDDEQVSPTEERVGRLELQNNSASHISITTNYGCKGYYSEGEGKETAVVKPGDNYNSDWTFRCTSNASTNLAIRYKFLSGKEDSTAFVYSLTYLPFIADPLKVGDIIALKGHTDDVKEFVLEPKNFATESYAALGEGFLDRIHVDGEKLSIRGFTEEDIYYLGFPDHELNDYVVPGPGFETEEGLLMQKLELKKEEIELPEGEFSHPNLSIVCDESGCAADRLTEIKREKDSAE